MIGNSQVTFAVAAKLNRERRRMTLTMVTLIGRVSIRKSDQSSWTYKMPSENINMIMTFLLKLICRWYRFFNGRTRMIRSRMMLKRALVQP